jgi:hypothetical protein
MGNIAKKRRGGVWIYVQAVDNSKIVVVPARVDALVYLQDIARNIGPMPLKESINIIPVERCTTIPPEIVREWLYSPEISPRWKPSPFNNTA